MRTIIHAAALLTVLSGLCGCRTASVEDRTMEHAAPHQTVAEREQAVPSSETPSPAQSAESVSDKPSADESNRAKAEHDLRIAQVKLEKARLDLDHQQADDQDAVTKAEADLALAKRKLDKLESNDGPLRLDKARLSLVRKRDSLQEAVEEMEQLEMMYSEEDLADKTREIVLRRGQRRLERAKAELGLEERDFNTLEGQTLPLEGEELRNTVAEKTRALESAKRKVDANALAKRIAVMEAEFEVQRCERALTDLDSDKNP